MNRISNSLHFLTNDQEKEPLKKYHFSHPPRVPVGLLSGMALTVGISELVAGATVSGSSRIMAALFVALQLGFGMAVGEAAVFWSTKSPAHTCPAPQLSPWWQIVWWEQES